MSVCASIAICIIASQPVSGVVHADDIGLIAGLYPDAIGLPDALLAAVVAAPPERRSLAWLALARALYARGYAGAADFVPVVCEGCGDGNAPAPYDALLIGDRRVIDGIVAASAQEQLADPSLRADTRSSDRITRLRAAVSNFNLGWSFSRWGEFTAAEPLQREALGILQAALPPDDVRLAAVKLGLARTALGLDRSAEALLLIDEVLTTEVRARGVTRLAADAMTLRARAERIRGDSCAAEASVRNAIEAGARDTAGRGDIGIAPAAIDAAIARIGDSGFAEANVDAEALVRLKTAMADAQPNLFRAAEGERFALLAQMLLDRDANSEALAAAQTAVALAPDDPGAALPLGLAELRGGVADAARLDDIASILDQQGWGPGAGSPDVIAGRTLLARLYGERRVSDAWVQIRQGAMGAEERLRSSEGGDDITRSAIAFRGVFREKVRVAWIASDRPPLRWPDTQRRFSIFFDIDRYEITPSAMPALDRIAAIWRVRGGEITIAGNLDGMGGTREYAIGLSQRLAGAAQRRLETLGVAPGSITTIGYGKERPMVQPREGRIAERRNRRVDIEIKP